MYVRVLATVHTRGRALTVYILYVYIRMYMLYTCVQYIVFTIYAQLQYLLFPDVSQVTCQATVQCVLVYTINTSRVFLLFSSTSDTAHGT